jgi:hypothetical protein
VDGPIRGQAVRAFIYNITKVKYCKVWLPLVDELRNYDMENISKRTSYQTCQFT